MNYNWYVSVKDKNIKLQCLGHATTTVYIPSLTWNTRMLSHISSLRHELSFHVLSLFQGRIVFLFSIGSWDAAEVPFDDVMRAYIYLLEVLLENAENQVSGFVIVENFHQYTLSQAMSLKPSDLQKMVSMLQVKSSPFNFLGLGCLFDFFSVSVSRHKSPPRWKKGQNNSFEHTNLNK